VSLFSQIQRKEATALSEKLAKKKEKGLGADRCGWVGVWMLPPNGATCFAQCLVFRPEGVDISGIYYRFESSFQFLPNH